MCISCTLQNNNFSRIFTPIWYSAICFERNRWKLMNRNSIIKFVGVIYALTWLSQIPYLFPPPFQQNESIQDLAMEATQSPDWIKQQSSIKDKTADELETSILTEIRINWIESSIFIVMGIVSGCLLIQRRKVGYFLTFFLSILMICIKFFHFVRYRSHTFSLDYYKFLLQYMPVQTIHGFFIQLVLLSTVVFLMYIYLSRKEEQ